MWVEGASQQLGCTPPQNPRHQADRTSGSYPAMSCPIIVNQQCSKSLWEPRPNPHREEILDQVLRACCTFRPLSYYNICADRTECKWYISPRSSYKKQSRVQMLQMLCLGSPKAYPGPPHTWRNCPVLGVFRKMACL
jgi:hypothetical protein